MRALKLVISGVGGQGTLLASRLLAEAAIRVGYDAIIGETYGMAQRGGPVMGHLQIGGEDRSPQIPPGEADALLGFEEAEAVRRGAVYLKEGGLAIVNTRRLPPAEVISGIAEYPRRDALMALLLEVTDNIVSFDATALAEEAGDPVATNVVMLGALCESGLLPYPEETLLETLRESVPARYLDVNLKAFMLGKKAFTNHKRQKTGIEK